MKKFFYGLLVGLTLGLLAVTLVSWQALIEYRKVEEEAYVESYQCRKYMGLLNKENLHITREYDRYRRNYPGGGAK